MLRNVQIGMNDHPVDQIRHLTHAAAHARRLLVRGNGQAFLVSSALCRVPDQMPERKGLARADQDMIKMRRGERQIDSLVFLQAHIDISKAPPDQGLMRINDVLKRFFGLCPCKAPLLPQVLQ